MTNPDSNPEPLYFIEDTDSPMPGFKGAISINGIPTEDPRTLGTGDKDPGFVNHLFLDIIAGAGLQNEGDE